MAELSPGTILRDRYTVLSLLGQGSFSRVYLADDSQWKGNLVALKEIRTDHLSEREYALLNGRFLQEAALLMSLQHKGLPRIVEFFAQGPCYYLALQWIPGKNLEELIQAGGPAEEATVLDWGLQISAVLEYLHSRHPHPITLGDLKPANVVRQFDGELRVIDFGVARHANLEGRSEIALVSPGFSAPEQYRGAGLDERSDIYSLGATLYWTLQPIALDKFRFEIPPIRRFRTQISTATEQFLATCLANKAQERFPSLRHVREALSQIQEQNQKLQPTPSEILSVLYRQKKDTKL